MSNIFETDAIAAGLDELDIQAMAKRQFFASVAAAIVIGLGVILMVTAPTPRHYAEIAGHKAWTAQQPRFANRTAALTAEATRQRQIELP